MAVEPETVRGTLGLDIYAPGSKGEYRAVVLTTASGERLVVRRVGANPYDDPELVALAGTDIEATGRRHRDILLVDGYTTVTSREPRAPTRSSPLDAPPATDAATVAATTAATSAATTDELAKVPPPAERGRTTPERRIRG